MHPILSVIIPTHNRPHILRRCLEHLERQTIADQIEVIVVDDESGGESQPATVGAGHAPPLIKYVKVPPCHQGAARNAGVKEARGKYILFIGDDIFLAPDACEKHLAIHKIQNSKLETNLNFRKSNFEIVSEFEFGASKGVLGFTTWDPVCGITPVMKWLESSGWQFGYPAIQPFSHSTIPPAIQHKFTYTSHISLPTEIARKFPFREDVSLYGWEDVEWGWRLKQANIPLFYEPDAKALHHHHMTMEDSLKRMEMLGQSAVVMERTSAAFLAAGLVPRGLKRWKYRIAAMLPGMRGKHAHAFLLGLRR